MSFSFSWFWLETRRLRLLPFVPVPFKNAHATPASAPFSFPSCRAPKDKGREEEGRRQQECVPSIVRLDRGRFPSARRPAPIPVSVFAFFSPFD